MAHINLQEIQIIYEEAKDVAFLIYGCLKIQMIYYDGMRQLVKCPFNVQSSLLGPSRHPPVALQNPSPNV